MSFDAGSAHASYILDVEQPKRAAAELRALFAAIKRDAAGIGAPSGIGGGGIGGGGQAAALTQQSAAAARAATGLERLRASEVRVAVAGRDYATALQLISAQLSSAQPGTLRYNNLLAQQATLTRQAAQATSGGLTGALGGLKTAMGGLGIVLGARQLVQYGIDAGGAALELRETENSLRAVAGNTTTYNAIIETARKQQVLFGGSLQDNIEGLSGLAVQSRISGASLTQLVDLQQRLTVLDPAQGAQGARIALAEALSGNISSLSRRFEIPRAALAKLNDTTIPVTERLKVLDQFLSKVGITSEAVAGRIDKDAKSFRELGQTMGDIKIAIGEGLVGTLGPVAHDLNDIAQALILLRQEGSKAPKEVNGFNAAIAEGATPVGAFRDQIGVLAIAMNLLAGNEEGAGRRVEELLGSTTHAATQQQVLGGAVQLTSAELQRQASAVTDLADRHQRLISLTPFDLSDRQAAAARALAEAEQHAADVSLVDAAAKDVAATKTELLQAHTQAVADAFIAANPHISATGIALAVAAKAIDPTVAEVVRLTLQLRGLKTELAGFTAGRPETGGDALARVLNAPGKNTAFANVQADAAAAARSAQILAIGTHNQKLFELNRIYQQQVRQFGRGSAEAIAAETNLIQERAAKQRVSTAARTGLQLDTLEQNSGLQLARTQRENLERLRDQQEDFDVGRSRKQEDFDRARIRLLAGGRRFEAARLGEDFARDQRRAREDFDRQRGRTLRNNQEGTGDIDARTDLRQGQILARARLARGGGGGGAAIGGGGIGAAGRGGGGLPALPGGGGSPIPLILKIQLTSLPLQIDGKTFIDATWSEIEQRVDLDLSEELATIGIVLPPGGTQTVVAGAP